MKTKLFRFRAGARTSLSAPSELSAEGGRRYSRSAFTLLELLVVLAIIGILAAIAMPVVNHFKPSYVAAATRQMLDDLARARQLAITHRTTVYMVFVPAGFWTDGAYGQNWTPNDFVRATNLFERQYIGYTFVSLRSMGDQPGQPTTRFLGPWRSLPDGAFIHPVKFSDFNPTVPVMQIFTNIAPLKLGYDIYGFRRTDRFAPVPFPNEDTRSLSLARPYIPLPYIAFDYMGRLASGRDEVIPLARGNVSFSRDPATKAAVEALPSVIESPVGNSSNAFNVICVDWLTGRARAERQEVK